MIKKCSCEHEYQDAQHGVNNRVHNKATPRASGAPPRWRCTVCGDLKE